MVAVGAKTFVQPSFSGLLCVLTFVAGMLAAPAKTAASDADAAAQFIRDFTDEAISSLTDPDKDPVQIEAEFRELLVRGFYLDGISRFALGRYWRGLDSQTQADYQAAFENYLVATYSRRIDSYSGHGIEVLGARKRKRDFYVQSLIKSDEEPDVRVDWRVRNVDGAWKIVDVIVERISMVATQRDEFSSVIRRSNGDVTQLLAQMEEMWESHRADGAEPVVTN